jgi:hypothetical protein
LDNRLSQIQPSERPEEKAQQQVQRPDKTANEGLTESEHKGVEDDLSEPEDFQAVQIVEDFLMNGAPFQRFLLSLGLSLLPVSMIFHQLLILPTGHPDDIQSTYIPMTVVLAILSMSWSATSILKQF